jgi:hypothetical protein
MCLLHGWRTGRLIEWRWTGLGWDKPDGVAFVTTPEAMARVGWRFHSIVTPEEETK